MNEQSTLHQPFSRRALPQLEDKKICQFLSRVKKYLCIRCILLYTIGKLLVSNKIK